MLAVFKGVVNIQVIPAVVFIIYYFPMELQHRFGLLHSHLHAGKLYGYTFYFICGRDALAVTEAAGYKYHGERAKQRYGYRAHNGGFFNCFKPAVVNCTESYCRKHTADNRKYPKDKVNIALGEYRTHTERAENADYKPAHYIYEVVRIGDAAFFALSAAIKRNAYRKREKGDYKQLYGEKHLRAGG